MRRLPLLIALLLSTLVLSHAGESGTLTLVVKSEQVELATDRQKLVFTRTEDAFVLSTFVRDRSGWRSMFDAGRPLLEGSLFNLKPEFFEVLTDTLTQKTLKFTGTHREPYYSWTMHVEASVDSPLFRFVITCHLTEPLTLESAQPTVSLWMQQSKAAFHLDQGPDSIYGSAGIPHNFGFPAAYLWDDRREAAVFFNMTPMRWMQPDGVARFHDLRIMTRSESGQTGLGMHFKKLSGRRLPAGDMTVEFFLHQNDRETKPSGLEALDTLVQVFSPLHPAESAFPRNQLTGAAARWEPIARQAMADLSSQQLMGAISAPWRDEPLELVSAQEKMLVHPSVDSWDFSTVNNHLTPWLLLARLHGDIGALKLGLQKVNALPRFYDPRSRLIRHGTRQPPHVGDLEMSWQNFFFHQETLRVESATAASDFNPAVAGRFLMATAGLRELARNTDFVFPQWFDPYEKKPAAQNDVKSLGLAREPWQAGSYAYLMMQAFKITADKEYLTEAQRGVGALMEDMEFRVCNQIYDRHYKDPVEFPLTELFGNAYGIAAAYQLYEATRDSRFLRYSRDFMNTLLRLTFWYEDETTPVSRELSSAGLFYPHGGAHVATPWETSEAHLMIAWTLKHDREHPLTELLLKLSNLNRINFFYFFPITWTEPVLALDKLKRPPLGQSFPIEPFYSLEGIGGHRGRTASYMAGLALWNDWLYEALAESNDRTVMVLNLDAMEDYESALSGLERHFLAYNPTQGRRTCQVQFKHLPQGEYLVTNGLEEESHSGEALRQGLALTLAAGEHRRVTVRRSDHPQRQAQLWQQRSARYALIRVYQLLQERAILQGGATMSAQFTTAFTDALSACRDGRFAISEAIAEDLRLKLQSRPSVQSN